MYKYPNPETLAPVTLNHLDFHIISGTWALFVDIVFFSFSFRSICWHFAVKCCLCTFTLFVYYNKNCQMNDVHLQEIEVNAMYLQTNKRPSWAMMTHLVWQNVLPFIEISSLIPFDFVGFCCCCPCCSLSYPFFVRFVSTT